MKLSAVFRLLCCSGFLSIASAFVTIRPRAFVSPQLRMSDNNWASDMANGGGIGGIERLEFKIYPDGKRLRNSSASAFVT